MQVQEQLDGCERQLDWIGREAGLLKAAGQDEARRRELSARLAFELRQLEALLKRAHE